MKPCSIPGGEDTAITFHWPSPARQRGDHCPTALPRCHTKVFADSLHLHAWKRYISDYVLPQNVLDFIILWFPSYYT